MSSQSPDSLLKEANEQIEQLSARVEVLVEQLEAREKTIRELQAQVKHLIRQLFGPKSDRPTDEAQMLLMEIMAGLENAEGAGADEEEDQGEAAAGTKRKKKRKSPVGRQMFPAHLDRQIVNVDLPEEQKIDLGTGKKLELIGYEESEQLLEKPAELIVRVIRRAKYALPKEAQGNGRPGVVTASIPAEYRGPIEKCKVAVEVLVMIIVLKYCYHMPLYRLQERYWRLGRVWLPRSTMCGWVRGCAEALEPIWKEMRRQIIASGRIGFDDTRVSMLDPKAGKVASTRMWSYSGLNEEAPYQVYDFRLTREMEGPLEFLGDFRGIVLGDALSTNKAVVRRRDQIELAGCWDHARRHFVDASDENGRAVAEALAYIKRLYKVESELKQEGVDAERRRSVREERAAPLLADFKNWLEAHKDKYLPKSGLRMAIHYTLNHWQELTLYLKHGDLPISNCLCEQSFKAIATGRKNWLFFGSQEGGRSAATIYSIIMTCRRLDIDPQKYLADVLRRVNDHPAHRIEELLPDRWKQARVAAGEEIGLRLEDYRPLRRAS